MQILSSNYTLYGDISSRVMQVVKEFVPRTEVYSIDEIFADFSGFAYHDLSRMAEELRETVMRCTRIPVSIGIGKTKTLAKMANCYAKKTRPDDGVFCADDEQKVAAMLQFTEAGDVCGIGHQHSLKLQTCNVRTAADFVALPEDWVLKELTVVGLRLQKELKGISCIKWEEAAPARKAICTSRSFGHLVRDKREIQQAIATYTAGCARKLRSERQCAREVHVFLQTNVHRRQDAQYLHSVNLNIPVATNATNELLKYTMTALHLLYQPGYNYHKTGVIVKDLVPEKQIQYGLFDTEQRERNDKVMTAVDDINTAYGYDTVRPAVQEFSKAWKLRAAHLSKNYTTRWNELPTINAK